MDKKLGLRPTWIRKVLQRIAGEVAIQKDKKDIIEAAGCLQLCTGQEAGSETVIHAIHEIFDDNKTEAILLVDTENAFNTINKKVLLPNIENVCLELATFIQNCYIIPAR